jgi:phosphatidylserine/phosphatidylglycerophosphate/cardiolipin synthase-like enzyme
MRLPDTLLDALQQLVDAMALEYISALAAAVAAGPPGAWQQIKLRAQQGLPNAAARDRVSDFIDQWQQAAPDVLPVSMALTLETAASSVAAERWRQTLSLVWTGPHPPDGPALRRTDQALLEIITGARHDLLIVTFAIYKISAIQSALMDAAARGVQLDFIIESPKESEGKIAYDNLSQLGPPVVARAQVYHWPSEKRPKIDGQHGSLHVKCAVADANTLLLSSANLTDYALNLNMEMGLLVRGGDLPAQVTRHFRRLIANHTLVSVGQH